MTRRLCLIALSMVGMGACAAAAGATPPAARVLAARLLTNASAKPGGEYETPAAKGRVSPVSKAAMAAPLVRVRAANRRAVREPVRDYYVGAAHVYPWSEGALYRLYAAPEQVSDIALQPGEALISVAAGDTARWVIGDTSSGSGAARRVHVLVKPSAMGLATNLVIATDRRVYHIEARSNARTAMPSMSWTYPEDALLALRPSPSAMRDEPLAAGVALEALNFNYRIEGGRPAWRPLRAFDDGRQVFIEFPAALAQGEAPPLFVTGATGRPELVNYRVRGRYYVVDRLFGAAELRLGERRQQVVRIVRTGAALDRRRAS